MASLSFVSSGEKDMEDMRKRFRAFMDQRRYTEATDVGRQWLEKSRSVLGPDHPDTLSIMYLWGTALHTDGNFDEAERALRQLLKQRQGNPGLDPRDTIAALDALCETLCSLHKYNESLGLLEDELRLCEEEFGLQHELTIKTLRNTAQIYRMQDDLYLASSVLLRALELSEKGFGRDHHITLIIQGELDEVRGRQDSLGLRQDLAAKHGLPIPGDLLAGFKSIDISQLLRRYQTVHGMISGGPEVTNATARRMAAFTGSRPRPAINIPSVFQSDTSEDESPSVPGSPNHTGETVA
jgi:tetratricopeptide (TPR) repeat protein